MASESSGSKGPSISKRRGLICAGGWVVHKSEREKGGGGKTVGGEEKAARDIPYLRCLCC